MDDLAEIRQDNLDRLICDRGESNNVFAEAVGMNAGTIRNARRGNQPLSDKSCVKIVTKLGLPQDHFDGDNRTGDKPEKKRKRGTIATKMVTIRFEGDSFNVSVEVNEKKARSMIMGLLHDG